MSCRATGCARRTTGWSRYCSAHKTRFRRHGHPDQQAITKSVLTPQLETVRGYVDRNPDSPLWPLLEASWGRLVDHSQSLERHYWGGKPTQMQDLRMAQEVLKLQGVVPLREAIIVVAAIVLLQRQHPQRFRSHRAFTQQVSGRVRGLSETNVGTWYDHQTRKVKRVYRDLPRIVSLLLGRWVLAAFGSLGLWIHGRETALAERRQLEAVAHRRALQDLE